MKVSVQKEVPGVFTFTVKRTRRGEGPSMLVRGVLKEDLRTEVAKAVQLTTGKPQAPSQGPS